MMIVSAAFAQDVEDRVAWLSQNSTTIRTIDPEDDDFADLQPLKKAIGEARIVQLGEQSHGDGATFLAKERLISFLQEQMGFNVLAWEAGLSEAEAANAALRSGTSVLRIARQGIPMMWTEGPLFVPLFEYIRSTQATKRPLRLTGFDIQGPYAGYPKRLFDFIDKLDPNIASDLDRKTIQDLFHALMAKYRPAAEDRASSRAALQKILTGLRGKAGDRDIRFYLKVVENLLALEEMLYRGGPQTGAPIDSWRDLKMAENIMWLADEWYPGQKIVVWAASLHIARNLGIIETRDADAYKGYTTMGTALHQKLGTAVYTVGFTAYQGTFGNPRMTPITLQAPAEGSLEALFHATGKPYLFVDFRGLSPEHWLRKPLLARPFGYAPMRSDWTGNFDGMVFTDVMFPNTVSGTVPDGVLKRR